jgi:hypothetical protein
VALNNLGEALNEENLQKWLMPYQARIANTSPGKKIGVVMAGNIPAVGFHDFMCVLISGNTILAKLSSSDNMLLPAMAAILTNRQPEWLGKIEFSDGRLEHFDAIIATGSTNTSLYFERYFGKYPHIIRRNRNSIAVLTGSETDSELDYLADDIMLFFGMGCRSISKIYVPSGYDFAPLIAALGKYANYANHNKYRNNYDYNRSIFMVSQVPVIDTGFLLLKEDQSVTSRIAMLHYEFYTDVNDVVRDIADLSGSLQCVVCNTALPVNSLRPGEAQRPALWEYADGVDTLEFLLSLK